MRILLIEDDQRLAKFMEKGLTEEQYSVDMVHDGMDGVLWATTYEYDLIVLDIMLPKKDGITVCKEIRNKGVESQVIMLTARDSVDDKIKGLDAGADDYLAKPFSFDELLARIRALLRRMQKNKLPVLQVADLILDPVSHTVTRQGREIILTGKEYALLEYLMRNRDKVVTETNIIEHVWNTQIESHTNVINVYIHYLRNKIEKGFDTKLIHTIRSVGYILKDGSDD
ncbi:MAG: response regulator transcription factor [Desulfotignum balticum]|jgi:heavy metal response regulator|uniref:Response regulator transcription factor n=1 Tax=Desulfotignum balticum TaxID=115781 RepID=A0A931CUH2_9BACT|nr:response regulator transcription factor [Desulfotignum balticum]